MKSQKKIKKWLHLFRKGLAVSKMQLGVAGQHLCVVEQTAGKLWVRTA